MPSWKIVVPGALTVGAFVLWTAWPGDKPTATSPAGAVRQTARFPTIVPTDRPVDRVLEDLLAVGETTGPERTRRYRAAQAALRAEPDEAVARLASAYAVAAEDDYNGRYQLVYELGRLELAQAVPALVAIAAEPMPPAIRSGEHTTYEEEAIIRMHAVDGLARLAMDGHAEAVAALGDLLDADSKSVRGMAAYYHVRLGGDPEEARERLPAADGWMADLRAGDINTDGALEAPPRKIKERR